MIFSPSRCTLAVLSIQLSVPFKPCAKCYDNEQSIKAKLYLGIFLGWGFLVEQVTPAPVTGGDCAPIINTFWQKEHYLPDPCVLMNCAVSCQAYFNGYNSEGDVYQLNYRPNGRRRFERSLKRLLQKPKQFYQGLTGDGWRRRRRWWWWWWWWLLKREGEAGVREYLNKIKIMYNF